MKTRESSDFSQIWSSGIARFGYFRLPLALLFFLPTLGITAAELQTLCYILAHRWTRNDPFPSLAGIAKRARKSESAIRASVRSLEAKGIIVRISRQGQTNKYSVDPLIIRLETLIKATKKGSYFQPGLHTEIATLPSLKTDTKINKTKLDINKKAVGEGQQSPAPLKGESMGAYRTRWLESRASGR